MNIVAAASLLLAATAHANPYECLIEPNQSVEIRSSVEGVIEKVMVKRGDRVRVGQVLAQLESNAEMSAVELARYRAEVEGRIATARNRSDYAAKKLDRSNNLYAKSFVAAQVRDEAEAEKRITESELKEATENREIARFEHRHALDLLSRRTLRSPIDGVVMDRLLNPGDLAEAGTGRKPILKLVQVAPLRVEVVLPLAAYGKLKPNSAADVLPEGLGGHYNATVTVIDSVFDSASGTFGVRLTLPNAKGDLPAGIRCQVDFPALRALPAKAKPVASK
ncbi:MAG: efflux RND transporter periplasmic adaptor subunit [Pseudomonadota bacterium]